MPTRVYKLPSDDAERERLVASVAEKSAEVLGYPAREANLAHWRTMPITELRRIETNWNTLILKYRRSAPLLDSEYD